jgi:hypothetical protein
MQSTSLSGKVAVGQSVLLPQPEHMLFAFVKVRVAITTHAQAAASLRLYVCL